MMHYRFLNSESESFPLRSAALKCLRKGDEEIWGDKEIVGGIEEWLFVELE